MIPSEFMLYIKQQVKFLKEEEERHQRRNALMPTLYANAHRRKGQKAYSIDDFLPKKPQTPQQMLKQVEMLNRLFGGEDKRTQNGSS